MIYIQKYHNCYDNNSNVAANTLNLIKNAAIQKADLIELDLVYQPNQLGDFVISHERGSNVVIIEDVLSDLDIINSNTMLFFEMKSDLVSLEIIRGLLRQLMNFEMKDYNSSIIDFTMAIDKKYDFAFKNYD